LRDALTCSIVDAARGGALRSSRVRNMTIELSRQAREDAIASIQKYFEKNGDEPIGNIAAGALLGFFLDEIGPSIYNKAVADVQERLQQRIAEIDYEIHEDEFQYWKKYETKPRTRK
jgi:uncharacterized protein (DUF2164 family)